MARNPWHALVAIAFGVMMVTLDGTVVSVANPAIGASLGATFGELQWVTHAYLLALTASLITMGNLGDRFGHRRVYLVGVLGFLVTSVAIGFSPTVQVMIGLRTLQGVFGAALLPCALGMLRAQFPAHLLNRALGLFSAVVGASTAAGPVVGGLLVSAFGWQSVFFLNAPVGIIACVLGLLLLVANRPTDATSSTDLPGAVLLAAALGGLVLGLVTAQEHGWGEPTALLAFAASVGFGALFVWRQQRARNPLLPMSLFTIPSLSIGTVLMLTFAVAMFGTTFFLTFYLQNVHGTSAMGTGIQLLPLTVLLAVVPSVAGRLIDTYGIRYPVVGGLCVAALGMFALSTVDVHGGGVVISAGLAVLGVGLGVVNIGATAAIVGSAPQRHAGVAGGLQTSALHLGGSLGPAILGAVVAGYVGRHFADDAVVSRVAQGRTGMPGGETLSREVFTGGLCLALVLAGCIAVCAAGAAMFLPTAHQRAPSRSDAADRSETSGSDAAVPATSETPRNPSS